MTVVETIPIDNSRVRNEEPFNVRVTDLVAWPDQEIIFYFEYNEYAGRWIWEVEHETMGTIIARSMANMGVRYEVLPYVMFKFKDPKEREERITSNNLGDRVQLCVYPGPLGGSFLDEAGISEEEERRLLRRDWWSPTA